MSAAAQPDRPEWFAPELYAEDDAPSLTPAPSPARRFTDGATFIFDMPADPVPVWGHGQAVLWAEGEAVMIYGGSGVGKTTLAGQLVRALIFGGDVLGYPVEPAGARVLYLAMDRPRQAARSLARQFRPAERVTVSERLVVWQGPPPADLAREPELLAQLCRDAGASHVIVDSLKDAAVGLVDDSVGAGYNRARQHALADGVQVCELHHQVKARQDGPKGIDAVYGSTWITAGAGSVIHLAGDPGDPVVKLRHLKQPAAEVGPLEVIHDHAAGKSRVAGEVGPLDVLDARGGALTARELAAVLTDTDRPKPADKERARRRLDALVREGALVAETDHSQGIGNGITVYRRAGP